MNTDGILREFNNLKSLKGDERFVSYFRANKKNIDSILDQLACHDPNDIVGIARLQGQYAICKARQDEYDCCEQKVFDLEQRKASSVKRGNETGIVPPLGD